MQSTFSIRLEEETKASMDVLCEALGLSMSAAFNIFAKAFVREGGFPFEVKFSTSKEPMDSFWAARKALNEKYTEEVSLDEINGEIQRVRSERITE